MMGQVFVAAWVGITVGWLGFGWALAEAPAEMGGGKMRYAATQTLLNEVHVGSVKELNLRG
jgi:hypothetical protein